MRTGLLRISILCSFSFVYPHHRVFHSIYCVANALRTHNPGEEPLRRTNPKSVPHLLRHRLFDPYRHTSERRIKWSTRFAMARKICFFDFFVHFFVAMLTISLVDTLDFWIFAMCSSQKFVENRRVVNKIHDISGNLECISWKLRFESIIMNIIHAVQTRRESHPRVTNIAMLLIGGSSASVEKNSSRL